MNSNPFFRLAPFIQEYIWRHNWDELRDVQVRAIDAILDTPGHVLISAGTASGKTEAAFFPMLTLLSEQRPESFGILYIGPLKALINDQFERISDLLDASGFPIFAWHGDRAQAEKNRAVTRPCGVLQITPEALEGLLMNHAGDAAHMFDGLRFIIIDELHAFTGTDRGIQLQCLLTRVDRLVDRRVRRVGLSATIHDYTAACAWLSAGTDLGCTLIESREGRRTLVLSMEHFTGDDAALYDYLYRESKNTKCLIFADGRSETERVVLELSGRANSNGEPDIFRVHHGSVSAASRTESERALRDSDGPNVVAATSTLELGIDIGGLDRVIQLGAPWSCSSFVQRLGRVGRRGTAAVMLFATHDSGYGIDDIDGFNTVLRLKASSRYRAQSLGNAVFSKRIQSSFCCFFFQEKAAALSACSAA